MVPLLALLLVLAVGCHGLQPILPEQLGETDWKIDTLSGSPVNVLQVVSASAVQTSLNIVCGSLPLVIRSHMFLFIKNGVHI